jgi:hypothetical protein
VLCAAVAWFTSRLPVWPAPPTTYQQAAAQQRAGCIIGGFLLLFVVAGAGIGYAIPQFIAESVPPVRVNILDPHHGVDGLGRLAQVCERMKRNGGSVFPTRANPGGTHGPSSRPGS